jgi:hypothetical protein
VQERLATRSEPLARRACETALNLVETIALALRSADRLDHLEAADELATRLRQQLRLGQAVGLLSEEAMLLELELTEPSFFLAQSDGAAERVAVRRSADVADDDLQAQDELTHSQMYV